MGAKSTTSNYLALWLSNSLLTILILLRLTLRKWRQQAFTKGDGWTFAALVFNGARVLGDYYTNQYGTPLSMSIQRLEGPPRDFALTALERSNLVLAGKLMLASRSAIVVVLWSLKMAVMDMLRGLLQNLRHEWAVACVVYGVLGGTFIASILAVFLECQELSLNWKLFPDPDKCANAALWMTTYEISNIVTDAILFFLLVISIAAPQITKWERLQLSVFGLGATMIAINIIRLIQGLPFTDVLSNRIVWGSVEVGIAAAVATLPTIYNLLRGDAAKRSDMNHRRPTATSGDSEANDCEQQSPQDPASYDFSWDTSVPAETDSKGKAPTPVPQASLPSSTTEEENWDSLSGSKVPIDTSFRNSRPCSGLPTMDELSEWIELDNMETRNLCDSVASPESDDTEYTDGEIFLATEINQEADRLWDAEERPHIVTIQGRRTGHQDGEAGKH